jgi:3-isopropylmalate dehydratase small subunit
MDVESQTLAVTFAGITTIIATCFAGIRLSRCTLIKTPFCSVEREVVDVPASNVAHIV